MVFFLIWVVDSWIKELREGFRFRFSCMFPGSFYHYMLNMTMCVIDQGPPSCYSFSGNFYRRQWTVDFIYHIYTYIFSLYVRFNWNTNLHRFGIQKSQICMVGDRLDTDILFGQNGGCKTLLVLSGTPFYAYFLYPDWTWNPISSFIFLFLGVTSLSMLQNPNNSIQPDFYTGKISDFLSLKAAAV